MITSGRFQQTGCYFGRAVFMLRRPLALSLFIVETNVNKVFAIIIKNAAVWVIRLKFAA